MNIKNYGLTKKEVKDRLNKGQHNKQSLPKSRSIGKIIRYNTFTLFNILNFFLASLIIISGSYHNLLFMGVVVSNIVIGVYQEIRSKRMIDKLSLLSEPVVDVVRDGVQVSLATEELVLDDVVLLSSGKQICADMIIISGGVEVNESLLTGESEPVFKKEESLLYSGSYVISGNCMARVAHVGEENYAVKITKEAKEYKKLHSDLMISLNKIIKFIAFVILPLGALLFFTQIQKTPVNQVLVKTVAALVGMIPEGLILLTSVALATGVVRLGKRRALVQELYAIENLARVDVICLDKTGTLTEGGLQLIKTKNLSNSFSDNEIDEIMCALMTNLKDNSATMTALRKEFFVKSTWQAEKIFPFSSEKKWSGANFNEQGVYHIGAPENILEQNYKDIQQEVETYTKKGYRVLVLAKCEKERKTPLAIFVLSDIIRKNAQKTLQYFEKQGVDIKIISGDNVMTVAKISELAGVKNYDKYIDVSQLKSKEELIDAASKYTIFGRVNPEEKKELINALKNAGHTVGMIGDGVNDVMALKNSDCSIAMAEGSDAARNISQLVLLDSDFSVLPYVVNEGRRVINNIERTASLFLVKTIFSFLLSVISIITGMLYVFDPIHLTLISGLTVGIPSFFLALEPNSQPVHGSFIKNVLSNAFPGAITVVLNVILLSIFTGFYSFTPEQLSTIATISTGFVGMLVLVRVCRPFNYDRLILVSVLSAAFVINIAFLSELYRLAPISKVMLLILIPLLLISYPVLKFLNIAFKKWLKVPAFKFRKQKDKA